MLEAVANVAVVPLLDDYTAAQERRMTVPAYWLDKVAFNNQPFVIHVWDSNEKVVERGSVHQMLSIQSGVARVTLKAACSAGLS